LVSLFDAVSLAVFSWWIYKFQNSSSFLGYFNRDTAKILLKDSWPLLLSSILLMVQARFDQILIKELLSFKELGIYVVSLSLVEFWGFIPMILRSSLSPSIISIRELNYDKYLERLQYFYSLMFFLFIIVAVPIFFFADFIIRLLYGNKFLEAGSILSLMAFRLFFANMGVARGLFILCENLFFYSLVTMAVGSFANILLNIMLIPYFNLKGAIFSSYISFFITTFLLDFFYMPTRKNVIVMLKGIFSPIIRIGVVINGKY
jgi:O-antigen/teichoic acid export membrane protein